MESSTGFTAFFSGRNDFVEISVIDTVITTARAGSVRCFVQPAIFPMDNPRIRANAKIKFLFFKIFTASAIKDFVVLIL